MTKYAWAWVDGSKHKVVGRFDGKGNDSGLKLEINGETEDVSWMFIEDAEVSVLELATN